MPDSGDTKELRILVLEDVPSDAELTECELRNAGMEFTLLRVDTRAAFEDALDTFKPNMILADYRLPAYSGRDALEYTRRTHPQIPVIMLTGAIGDESAVDLLKLGARDYVLKDRLARLAPAVKRVLSEERGVHNRKLAEGKYRALFTQAMDGIVLIDCATWKIEDANPEFEKQTGRTLEQLKPLHIWEIFVPEQQELARLSLLEVQRTGGGRSGNFTLHRPDGAVIPIELSAKFLDIQQQSFVQSITRDISERKRAEEALRHSNRALKTLSAANLALVRAMSEDELLQAVTDIIVEKGGYRLAVVSFAEDDPGKSLTSRAWAGNESPSYWIQGLSWADNEQGQLPISRTIRNGTTQICHDIASDPSFAHLRDAARAHGYRANITLPLSNDGKVFGGLSIYASDTDAFDDEEVRLLEELANDLAYGIVTLRTRVERERQAKFLRQSLEQFIQAIAFTVEARDPYTAGHQRRVSELATMIARNMGLPDEQVVGIQLAGAIHDLGKIRVPAEILSKPGRLSPIEFELIKTHAQAGYDILKDVAFPWPIADIIFQHHERLDGSGYPQGLKDHQILLESKIMAVADVVEAMSSHRPYRPSLGIDAALEQILSNSSTYYAPEVVDVCVKLFRERGYQVPA
jgi:PAS domain S-box-containing protein